MIDFFGKFNAEYKLKVDAKLVTKRTYSRYVLTKERLIDFMKQKYKVEDIPLCKINIFFIEGFYLYLHKEHECTNNTSMKFIQRLSKVVASARDSGIIQNDPFYKFKFHFDEVDRG